MTQDLQRELIGSVAQGKTKSGKVVADLFSTDTRLEYPVLVLFDLSMLEIVGIDPNDLGSQPIYRRFWAYYTENQEKLTSKGNPYRDVAYLEPFQNGNGTNDPAPMNDAMLSAILAELQKQTRLLAALVGSVSGPIEEPEPAAPDPGPQETPPEPATLDDWFGESTPTSPKELMQVLSDADLGYSSIRSLHDALAAKFGDTWRGWPLAGDLDAWSAITKAAMELAAE